MVGIYPVCAEYIIFKHNSTTSKYEVVTDENDQGANLIYKDVLSIYQWPMLNFAYHTAFTENEKQEVIQCFSQTKERPLGNLIESKVKKKYPGYYVKWIPSALYQTVAILCFQTGEFKKCYNENINFDIAWFEKSDYVKKFKTIHEKLCNFYTNHIQIQKRFSDLEDLNPHTLKSFANKILNTGDMEKFFKHLDTKNALQAIHRAIDIEEKAERNGDFLLWRGSDGFTNLTVSKNIILDSSWDGDREPSREMCDVADKYDEREKKRLKPKKDYKYFETKHHEKKSTQPEIEPHGVSEERLVSLSYGNHIFDLSFNDSSPFSYMKDRDGSYYLSVPIKKYLEQDLKEQLFFISPYNAIAGVYFKGEHHPRSKIPENHKGKVRGFWGYGEKNVEIDLEELYKNNDAEENRKKLVREINAFIKRFAKPFDETKEIEFENRIKGLRDLSIHHGLREFMKKAPDIDDHKHLEHDYAFEEPVTTNQKNKQQKRSNSVVHKNHHIEP